MNHFSMIIYKLQLFMYTILSMFDELMVQNPYIRHIFLLKQTIQKK